MEFTDPVIGKAALADRLSLTDQAVIDQSYNAALFMNELPTDQCLSDQQYEEFKTNNRDPDAIEDPFKAKPPPEYDICAQLIEEGFFEQLEVTYGPLPGHPESAGL